MEIFSLGTVLFVHKNNLKRKKKLSSIQKKEMNDCQYFEKTLTPTFASKSSEIFVGGCQRSSENIDIHRFSFLQ